MKAFWIHSYEKLGFVYPFNHSTRIDQYSWPLSMTINLVTSDCQRYPEYSDKNFDTTISKYKQV